MTYRYTAIYRTFLFISIFQINPSVAISNWNDYGGISEKILFSDEVRAHMSTLNIQKYTCAVHRVEWVDRWQTRCEIPAEDLLTFVQFNSRIRQECRSISSDKLKRLPFLKSQFLNKNLWAYFPSIILQFVKLTFWLLIYR